MSGKQNVRMQMDRTACPALRLGFQDTETQSSVTNKCPNPPHTHSIKLYTPYFGTKGFESIGLYKKIMHIYCMSYREKSLF
jgi:hypothetical protein